MAADDFVVAITGASGSVYGIRLLEVLLRAGRNVHLTISPAGVEVIEHELDRKVRLDDFDPAELLGDTADVLTARLGLSAADVTRLTTAKTIAC